MKAQYFKKAQSWSDDIYLHTLVSRNRYQIAFFTAMGYAALLTLALVIAVITKQVYLVTVHESPSGYNYVTLEKQSHAPKRGKAEIEADIVRYVTARESYHPATYAEQSNLVALLSASQVNVEYQLSQGSDNTASPFHLLQNKGFRKVQVKSILFLDAKTNDKKRRKHENLAQVNFVVIDQLFGRENHIETPFVALVSWQYRGTPNDIETMWKNWRGFEVSTYQVNAVNVQLSKGGDL